MQKTTKEIGDKAEKRAVDFLMSQGFYILETNYRYKRSEVDIIAQRNNVVHIVEVKYRSNNSFGFPEEFVDDKKVEMITDAAEFYLEEKKWVGFVQYDIIAITKQKIDFFEDAF